MSEFTVAGICFVTGVLCGMALSAGIVVGYINRHKEYWFEVGRNKGWNQGWSDHTKKGGKR